MKCPVCQKVGISDESDYCPQCNSDLTQFKLINSLERKIVRNNKRKSLLNIGLVLIALALASIKIISTINSRNSQINNPKVYEYDSLNIYKQKYESVLLQIDSLLRLNSDSQYFYYTVKEGDNLSSLALLFYNDISKVEVIAAENGIDNINSIPVKKVLKLKIIR